MFSHISPRWGRFFQVTVITFTIRTVKLFIVFLWRGKRKLCIVAFGMLKEKKRLSTLYMIKNLRWTNTGFACALADAIQRMHKDCKKNPNMLNIDSAIILLAICPQFFSMLFFWITLVFYHKGMFYDSCRNSRALIG